MGMIRVPRDSCNIGDDSTVGQTRSDLTQGVGWSLPLAIVDTVVLSGDGRGVADNRGGGNNGPLSRDGQGILSGRSSGDLGQDPGLAASRDSHDGQA